MVAFPQTMKNMATPTKEFYKLVFEKKIAHGGHPVLRWNVDNIFIKQDENENIRPDKAKSTEKIDGAVATIMALDRCLRCNGTETGSVYDRRGLITF
jgi:phage terminase large subunit-like protein